MVEIKVPPLGESVTQATVARWLKKTGDAVKQDEPIVELDTDKITMEVVAPAAGVITAMAVPEGGMVAVGSVLGAIGTAEAAAPVSSSPNDPQTPAANGATQETNMAKKTSANSIPTHDDNNVVLSPAARKLAKDANLDPATIVATGKGGRVTKADVVHHDHTPAASSPGVSAAPVGAAATPPAVTADNTPSAVSNPAPLAAAPAYTGTSNDGSREQRVRMTNVRKVIAERLKSAQNTAAILTTFNEIDMSSVMALRQTHQENFVKKYGVKLGFMSFFVKAVVNALKEIPAVNAEIDGDEIVFKNYYHIGVAVGTEHGLVVPVLRDADQLSFAEIETKIADFGKRAKERKLATAELNGGTFTISNGGTYGSLMSTPILNPPQSGILGMHKIQERPMVVNGKIEIRPMMYVALSYDHRIIDGQQAVTFLVRIKQALENLETLILGI